MEKSKGSRNQEQVIYDRLFDVILEQKLQPGSRLTEVPLAEIFGVSRTIIRRVLLRLSHEGVVEIKPNVGASVVATPPEDVEQYFEARKIIEGAIAKKLTGHLTDYQAEMLSSMVREENRMFDLGNLAKGLRKSTEFHFFLAEAAGNQALEEIAKQLIARTSLIVSQYNLTGSGGCACIDHNTLVDILQNGKPEVAEKMMIDHIDHIEQGLQLSEKAVEPDLYALLKDN
ncbi:GntR family transcriptional regulator [Thiomicrorhabdus hydrogeniphila]